MRDILESVFFLNFSCISLLVNFLYLLYSIISNFKVLLKITFFLKSILMFHCFLFKNVFFLFDVTFIALVKKLNMI